MHELPRLGTSKEDICVCMCEWSEASISPHICPRYLRTLKSFPSQAGAQGRGRWSPLTDVELSVALSERIGNESRKSGFSWTVDLGWDTLSSHITSCVDFEGMSHKCDTGTHTGWIPSLGHPLTSSDPSSSSGQGSGRVAVATRLKTEGSTVTGLTLTITPSGSHRPNKGPWPLLPQSLALYEEGLEGPSFIQPGANSAQKCLVGRMPAGKRLSWTISGLLA